ncbi:MAG: TIGR03067 domain-containing protein [Gemmataceae bacterium]|nr:TIGR03067 domain-containing protein [Gemmataceae bacterium]
MRIKALLGVFVAVLLVAADAKEEAKQLEGTWKVVSADVAGMKVPDDKIKDAIVIIKGDKLTLGDRGKDGKELSFTVDPSKKPKHIDLTDLKAKNAKSVPGIYALEKDELKLCIPLVEAGKAANLTRPESFETKDKAFMTITCKRDK